MLLRVTCNYLFLGISYQHLEVWLLPACWCPWYPAVLNDNAESSMKEIYIAIQVLPNWFFKLTSFCWVILHVYDRWQVFGVDTEIFLKCWRHFLGLDLNHEFITSVGEVVPESSSVDICWLGNVVGILILLSPPKVLEDHLVKKMELSS